MITNVIINIITTIINFLDGLLPHLTMPSWLVAGNLIPTAASNFLGEALYTIAPFFPSTIIAEIFVGICSLLPFIAAYTVAQWVWNHVPTVAGFGTH